MAAAGQGRPKHQLKDGSTLHDAAALTNDSQLLSDLDGSQLNLLDQNTHYGSLVPLAMQINSNKRTINQADTMDPQLQKDTLDQIQESPFENPK